MRYKETGNLHLEFHCAQNLIVDYIVEKYGEDAFQEIMKGVGENVYRAINDSLREGDLSEYLSFNEHFLKRENADFSITRDEDDTVRIEVRKCPATEQIYKAEIPLASHFCEQCAVLNQVWSSGSPFQLSVEKNGPSSCTHTIRKNAGETKNASK